MYNDEITGEHKNKSAEKVFSLGNIRLYECPVTFITEDTAFIMSAVFLSEDSGVLYHSGGWSSQPEWFVKAVGIYREELANSLKNKSA